MLNRQSNRVMMIMNMQIKWPFFLVTAFLVLAAFSCLTSLSAQPESALEWRQFRGPGGQGASKAEGVPLTWSADRNLAWKTALPGPGGSSPVVFREHVYVTCYSGYGMPGGTGADLSALQRHVVCLDRASGKILWKKDVPAAQPEEAKVREHGYASSTPVADDHRLYVFFGKSGAFAYDHKGRQLWQASVGSKTHGWGSAASPILFKDLVIINASVESEALVALDKFTGKEVWRAGGIKESWNTPVLVPVSGGRHELVLAVLGMVLGFDPETGEQLWSCQTGIGWYMVPSLAYHEGIVYCIGGRTGGALAVRAGGRGDVSRSHRLWSLSKGSNVSSPICHEGHLYWMHENLGILYCVEASRGKLVYEERIANAGQFYASPVMANGNLYFINRRGAGFVLAASPRFEQLARNELGDRSSFDASPVVDGNRLLVRSDRFLYCLASPKQAAVAPARTSHSPSPAKLARATEANTPATCARRTGAPTTR
jgi:outer membrane protein assembly factor BamB